MGELKEMRSGVGDLAERSSARRTQPLMDRGLSRRFDKPAPSEPVRRVASLLQRLAECFVYAGGWKWR